jgi:hypothetical protein
MIQFNDGWHQGGEEEGQSGGETIVKIAAGLDIDAGRLVSELPMP